MTASAPSLPLRCPGCGAAMTRRAADSAKPPAMRRPTPRLVSRQVFRTACTLIERPSTRLAKGIVSRCTGVRIVCSHSGK